MEKQKNGPLRVCLDFWFASENELKFAPVRHEKRGTSRQNRIGVRENLSNMKFFEVFSFFSFFVGSMNGKLRNEWIEFFERLDFSNLFD